MEEAEKLSDRLCIMKKGKIIAIGTANEMIEKTETSSFDDAFVKIVEENK